MHSDYDGELQALRDVVSAICSLVRDVAKYNCIDVERIDAAMNHWHKWRTARWEREVKDAERVLQKACSMSDYGLVGSRDKFVPQESAESIELALLRGTKKLEAALRKSKPKKRGGA